jgi:sarcosine oxidase subunit gamma
MPDILATASAFTHELPTIEGLHVEERQDIGLATLQVTHGRDEMFAARASSAFGVAPPAGPHRTASAGTAFIGTGPRTWLVCGERGSPGFAADLARTFEGMASVSDQSSGYCVLRLNGPRARAVLQSGLPVDLHPDAFAPGSAAVSVIAHVGVIVWSVDTDIWEIAFFRSMADSFAHWLGSATPV